MSGDIVGVEAGGDNQPEEPQLETIRSVRTFVVSAAAGGQTLAVLDRPPCKLDVRAARPARRRQARLPFGGDRVDDATARPDLANRDLQNVTLAAASDGFISRRQVEPFVEVRLAAAVFEIDAKGGLGPAGNDTLGLTAVATIALGIGSAGGCAVRIAQGVALATRPTSAGGRRLRRFVLPSFGGSRQLRLELCL